MHINLRRKDVNCKRKKRIFINNSRCFFTGVILYGLLGWQGESSLMDGIFFGLLGGGGLSMMLSTFILSVHFLKNRSTTFKVISALCFPITIGIMVFGGMIIFIPYEIYNAVQLIRLMLQRWFWSIFNCKKVENFIFTSNEETSEEERVKISSLALVFSLI